MTSGKWTILNDLMGMKLLNKPEVKLVEDSELIAYNINDLL